MILINFYNQFVCELWRQEPVFIGGWGNLEENGNSPDKLQEAEVRIIHTSKCNRPWFLVQHSLSFRKGLNLVFSLSFEGAHLKIWQFMSLSFMPLVDSSTVQNSRSWFPVASSDVGQVSAKCVPKIVYGCITKKNQFKYPSNSVRPLVTLLPTLTLFKKRSFWALL